MRDLVACVLVSACCATVGCSDDDPLAPVTSPIAVVRITVDPWDGSVPGSPGARVAVGDVVRAAVTIESAAGVGSVSFHVRYTEGTLEFVPLAAPGAFLRGESGEADFVVSEPDAGREVSVEVSRRDGRGSTGRGIVATIPFRAVGPGRGVLAFSHAAVRDPEGANLLASFVSTTIGVAP